MDRSDLLDRNSNLKAWWPFIRCTCISGDISGFELTFGYNCTAINLGKSRSLTEAKTGGRVTKMDQMTFRKINVGLEQRTIDSIDLQQVYQEDHEREIEEMTGTTTKQYSRI